MCFVTLCLSLDAPLQLPQQSTRLVAALCSQGVGCLAPHAGEGQWVKKKRKRKKKKRRRKKAEEERKEKSLCRVLGVWIVRWCP